jgi:hypothetical protein
MPHSRRSEAFASRAKDSVASGKDSSSESGLCVVVANSSTSTSRVLMPLALGRRSRIRRICFVYEPDHLYGLTILGQKVEWMHSNPLVCVISKSNRVATMRSHLPYEGLSEIYPRVKIRPVRRRLQGWRLSMMWCLFPSSVRRRRTGARIIFLLPRRRAESSFLRLFVGGAAQTTVPCYGFIVPITRPRSSTHAEGRRGAHASVNGRRCASADGARPGSGLALLWAIFVTVTCCSANGIFSSLGLGSITSCSRNSNGNGYPNCSDVWR